MRIQILALISFCAALSNAAAQAPPVDPALDLSRVPPAALASLAPDFRRAEASSKNFLPGDAPPFTASGPVSVGDPLSIITRRHANVGTLEAPLQRAERGGGAATLLEAGTPVFRWHIPASDASAVRAYWCGVNGATAHCFDDTALYAAAGSVPYAPAGVEHGIVFVGAAPAVREVEWAESGLPVMEWVRVFEGWERRRANVSYGMRINGTRYGWRETYYDRRDPNETVMRLQNGGRIVARPGADDRSAIIEITEPEETYEPDELEVWTRLTVALLGRPN